MLTIGWIHIAFAVVSLASGLVVLVNRKGTRAHRRIGWLYAVCMLGLNITALMLYNLTGSFGPFHLAAVLSLATVVMGVRAAVRRVPRGQWIEVHYYWMTWSYVGLIAAAASELVTRVPIFRFWWSMVLATAVVLTVGAVLVRRGSKTTLTRFRRAGAGAAG